ncbi:MAG: alanine--tRNA ligase [Candidatus Colwellbacteria bacterium CG10_big_fil_rev_8_21_14_0_10_41_28]|uniref:alanine--tRNA ligase n=1 Tax=Candidatus Colwellbacteria bacterium CG10_big_fil_rev_8_21_14_0_10_41_28 TaxID=1974539 RepID=A0A2H0VHT6_9BACT|nr:MAG: alanine--tRNA ligase [Candidatus Colwellbacteria bacterium CG10_big_fil_rev_8_21_14_0_10_41_28]
MTVEEIRSKYLTFFKDRGHTEIVSALLLPQDDPTTLLTGSGMQPLIPYLMGKKHPDGKRLTDSQKCFRAEDIEEVGDNRHTTFFEMLGNWSLGDYFKEEQLPWFFEFLVDELGIDPKNLYVTVFMGDEDNGIPRDDESADIWEKLFESKGVHSKIVNVGSEEDGYKKGMEGGRIFYYDSSKNWWSRKGKPDQMPAGELGGPDSEVFYEFTDVEHDKSFGEHCHPNCDCGRFLEIGNSVFMEYKKNESGEFEKLEQRNVDFGGGLERIAAAANGFGDVFEIDVFKPIIEKIDDLSPGLEIETKRIFADHLRGAAFLIADGVAPSNKEEGYVLRRLLRRVIAYEIQKDIHPDLLSEIPKVIVDKYKSHYKNLDEKEIIEVMEAEKSKFKTAIGRGLRELADYKKITAKEAFYLYETYGLPFELTKEVAPNGIGKDLKIEDFETEFERHKDASKAGAGKKFGGHGLMLDTGELRAADEEELIKVTNLHTATHLLQAALKKVVGDSIEQRGSDITSERTRFDFSFDRKLTEKEIEEVEEIVNEVIEKDLPVSFQEMPVDEAKGSGALFVPHAQYPEKVKVYFVGEDFENAFSKELCGGPHVEHTGVIGKLKIKKQEAVGEGIRRIRAVAEE